MQILFTNIRASLFPCILLDVGAKSKPRNLFEIDRSLMLRTAVAAIVIVFGILSAGQKELVYENLSLMPLRRAVSAKYFSFEENEEACSADQANRKKKEDALAEINGSEDKILTACDVNIPSPAKFKKVRETILLVEIVYCLSSSKTFFLLSIHFLRRIRRRRKIWIRSRQVALQVQRRRTTVLVRRPLRLPKPHNPSCPSRKRRRIKQWMGREQAKTVPSGSVDRGRCTEDECLATQTRYRHQKSSGNNFSEM